MIRLQTGNRGVDTVCKPAARSAPPSYFVKSFQRRMKVTESPVRSRYQFRSVAGESGGGFRPGLARSDPRGGKLKSHRNRGALHSDFHVSEETASRNYAFSSTSRLRFLPGWQRRTMWPHFVANVWHGKQTEWLTLGSCHTKGRVTIDE